MRVNSLARTLLLVISLNLFLFMAYTNCSQGKPGISHPPSRSTETGNPMTLSSHKLLNAICTRLTSCRSQLSLEACQAGVLATGGVDEQLGLPIGSFSSFNAIVAAEQAGSLIGADPNTCDSQIGQLKCSDTSVQGAYDPALSNPFANVFKMIPSGSTACASVYSSNPGRIYYVSTSGLDSNPGTIDSPFQTLHRGIQGLQPSDTLLVRGGVYDEEFSGALPSGTSWAAPVTLKAFAGENVTLSPASGGCGGQACRVFTLPNTSYFIVDGLILEAAGAVYDAVKLDCEYDSSSIVIPGTCSHHVRFVNDEIRNAPGAGIVVNSGSDDEFVNLDVHHNGSLLDSAGQGSGGIHLSGARHLVASSRVHDNTTYGILVYAASGCDENVIRGNRVWSNHGVGSTLGAGISLTAGDGSMAANNLIWANDYGLTVDWGATNAKLYNNSIFGNQNVGISIGHADGTSVKNNISYLSGSPGLQDLGFGSGTLTQNNWVDVDPLFVDAAKDDFHLAPGSPAIDSGQTLSEVPTDFSGVLRPQGAGSDIGAFEF